MKLTKKQVVSIVITAVVLIVIISSLLANSISADNSADNKGEDEVVANEFSLNIVDKMALTYIQSRSSDVKWTDEKGEYYYIYLNITVENLTENVISFGASSSDYYAKLDIGRAVNQPVYFQENRHLHDRIPYWTDIGYDDPKWDNIVFFYADSSLTEIEPYAKRTFYLAFQSHKNYANVDLQLVIYKSKFFKDPVVKTFDVGVIPILE